jgi:hypothetical protein
VCVRYYYEGELKVENLMPLEKSQNLRVVHASSESVELAWDYSLVQLNGMKDNVQYKTDYGQWQTMECNERTATIQGPQPSTKYTFRVHAPDQIFLREIGQTVEEKTNRASLSSYFAESNFTGTVGVMTLLTVIIGSLIVKLF